MYIERNHSSDKYKLLMYNKSKRKYNQNSVQQKQPQFRVDVSSCHRKTISVVVFCQAKTKVNNKKVNV